MTKRNTLTDTLTAISLMITLAFGSARAQDGSEVPTAVAPSTGLSALKDEKPEKPSFLKSVPICMLQADVFCWLLHCGIKDGNGVADKPVHPEMDDLRFMLAIRYFQADELDGAARIFEQLPLNARIRFLRYALTEAKNSQLEFIEEMIDMTVVSSKKPL